MNTETQTESQRLISLAYLRLSKGLLYGNDMLRVVCYEDTIKILASAITEIEDLIHETKGRISK